MTLSTDPVAIVGVAVPAVGFHVPEETSTSLQLKAIQQAAADAGIAVLGMDPVAFMVRVPVPFIFGTIVIQNMLKGSLFAAWAQPAKGILNVAAVIVIGQALAGLYAALAPVVRGRGTPGPPRADLHHPRRRAP